MKCTVWTAMNLKVEPSHPNYAKRKCIFSKDIKNLPHADTLIQVVKDGTLHSISSISYSLVDDTVEILITDPDVEDFYEEVDYR